MPQVKSLNQVSAVKTHAEIFDLLKSLVGSWEGKTNQGRILKVTYSLHARDSVLMETWALGPKSDALTMYHMDLGTLMASHYCPLCNQPRLLLSGIKPSGTFVFDFYSATNLADLSVAHQHAFEISIPGTVSFWRNETYIEGGVAESDEGVTYYRIKDQGAL